MGVVFTLLLLGIYAPEGFSQTSWSSLTDPSSSLSLTMGSNTSTFLTNTPVNNFFQWFNNTTSTSGSQSQSSPVLSLCGTYYTGTQSAQDCWMLQNNTAANGGLTFAHSGRSSYSGAGGGVTFDSSINTLTTYGQLAMWRSKSTGGLPNQTFIAMQEGDRVATAANFDFIGAFNESTYSNAPFTGMGIAHGTGFFFPLASIPVAPTLGNCVQFTTYPATDPRHWPLLVDSGVPCGTVNIASGGSLSSTAFVTGAGSLAEQTPSSMSTLDSSGNAAFAGTLSASGGKAVWNASGVQTTDANLPTAGNGHGVEIVNTGQSSLALATAGTLPVQLGSAVTITVPSPGWYRIVPEVVLTSAGRGGPCNAGAVQLELSYTQGTTGAAYSIPSWPMWNVASSSTLGISGTMTISNKAVGGTTDWIPARPMEVYSAGDISLTLNNSVLSNCATAPVVAFLYRVEAM
jgi:hypothetical protein